MRIKATTKEAYQLFHDGILALSTAEQYGIRVDVPYCKKMIAELDIKIKGYEKGLSESKLGKLWYNVFNTKMKISSDTQLRHLLFEKMKIKPLKMTAGDKNPSVDHDALELMDIDGSKDLLNVRKWEKAKGTYFESLLREQVNGIIHSFNNLHLVKTYRSSMDHVNNQNTPKRDKELKAAIRRAIIPRDGHQMGEVDYGGIEVCTSCCNHKDPTMINYVKDPTTDMHKDMAIQIYKLLVLDKQHSGDKQLRDGAKNGFVFPQFYGDWWKANAASLWKWKEGVVLSNETDIMTHLKKNKIGTLKQFEKHIEAIEKDFWETRFPIYNQWKDDVYKTYQKTGVVKLLTGFTCGGVMTQKEVNNYPMQGPAFHCLLWSFIELTKRMINEKWKSRLLFQVHDAVVFDLHPSEREYVLRTCKEVMTEQLLEAWRWIIVPLTIDADVADVDEPWNMVKGYKI